MKNESYFTIVENDIINDIEHISNLEFRLYVIISSLSNNKNGYCYLSYSNLRKKISISERQFYRCINNLVKYNYLIKIKSTNSQRVFLQPVVNRVVSERKDYNKNSEFNLFDYDWLSDRD